MITCPNCGKEVTDGAAFCANCGTEITCTETNNVAPREQVFVGKIRKCPSCGAELPGFTAICPLCGHELNTENVSKVINDFVCKIDYYDTLIAKQRRFARASRLVEAEYQKTSYIENYRFPNEREPILEAMSFIREKLAGLSRKHVNKNIKYWGEIWFTKGEQLYKTAGLLNASDAVAQELYQGILENRQRIDEKIKHSKILKIAIPAAIAVSCVVLLFTILLADEYSGSHEIRISQDANELAAERLVNPSQEYIISCLKNVDGIVEYWAITPENDPNKLLTDERNGTAAIFFSYDYLTAYNSAARHYTDIETDDGGCIEVFLDTASARDRLIYLKKFKYAGASCLVGTVVVRTSYYLPSDEQDALTSAIVRELLNNIDSMP